MFEGTPQSEARERDDLRRFLRYLDDLESYLDEYDEFFGLAFDENEPTKCVEKLTNFLLQRFNQLNDEH